MSADPADAGSTPAWTGEWTLGDRLRKIRRHVGDSQTDFAVRIGQNPKNYSTWEADGAKPRQLVAVAMRIEQETGVPASWVLGMQGSGQLINTQDYGQGEGAVVIPFPQATAMPSDHGDAPVTGMGRGRLTDSWRSA